MKDRKTHSAAWPLSMKGRSLPSRAWSSSSLAAGVEHCSVMAGLELDGLSKAQLIQKLKDCKRLLVDTCGVCRAPNNLLGLPRTWLNCIPIKPIAPGSWPPLQDAEALLRPSAGNVKVAGAAIYARLHLSTPAGSRGIVVQW